MPPQDYLSEEAKMAVAEYILALKHWTKDSRSMKTRPFLNKYEIIPTLKFEVNTN
jgi:hypothetical protein